MPETQPWLDLLSGDGPSPNTIGCDNPGIRFNRNRRPRVFGTVPLEKLDGMWTKLAVLQIAANALHAALKACDRAKSKHDADGASGPLGALDDWIYHDRVRRSWRDVHENSSRLEPERPAAGERQPTDDIEADATVDARLRRAGDLGLHRSGNGIDVAEILAEVRPHVAGDALSAVCDADTQRSFGRIVKCGYVRPATPR